LRSRDAFTAKVPYDAGQDVGCNPSLFAFHVLVAKRQDYLACQFGLLKENLEARGIAAVAISKQGTDSTSAVMDCFDESKSLVK
jgi:hypothetical protein